MAVIDVLIKVADLYQQEAYKGGLETGTVYLTAEDEAEIGSATAKEVGEVIYGNLQTNGVRETFPTLLGLPVVWGAEETKVQFLE